MYFEIKNFSVSRGPIKVIKDLNLHVEEGEIVSVIGANGAGKTTLLLAIIGLLKADAGTILFKGQPLTGLFADQILNQGIALCPSERHVFPRMTVEENLLLGAYIRKDKAEIEADLEKVFTYFPRLEERMKQYGGTLSGGEQQMLAMARAAMSAPKLLLLDEPSLGLAPIMIQELGRLIQHLNEDGTTILLVEQNAMLALEISSRTYVLEIGEIVLSDQSQNLIHQDSIRKAFLGE